MDLCLQWRKRADALVKIAIDAHLPSSPTHRQLHIFGVFFQLGGVEVKFRQTQAVADLITSMSSKEQGHAFSTEVPLIVLCTSRSVDLRVSVQISDTWNSLKKKQI